MNVYVFKEVEQLTDNYHNEGGLVVIARDKNHVKELIKETNKISWDDSDDFTLICADISLTDEEWAEVAIYPTTDDAKPRVFVFPDAGCC